MPWRKLPPKLIKRYEAILGAVPGCGVMVTGTDVQSDYGQKVRCGITASARFRIEDEFNVDVCYCHLHLFDGRVEWSLK